MDDMVNLNFFHGKRVFITGHTGFKGSWLCKILSNVGAELTGYSLAPPNNPNLFSICGMEHNMHSIIGDIRDKSKLMSAFQQSSPEVVIHMAAQPLVRDSYRDPAYTFETNIMGTVNVLECIRIIDGVKSFLNVTTDKVYQNHEWHWGYREVDTLGGFDPYSNSKSCSELVTQSYANSFFADGHIAISTVRAGNVIGGGDFANDRIIPDCVRAALQRDTIIVRNPHSIRPYQHVLDPLFAYLLILQKQYENPLFAGCYNVGPDDCDSLETGKLVELFCTSWGDGLNWEDRSIDGPHEASYLKLDCSKIKTTFGWKPRWGIVKAVDKTVEWTLKYKLGADVCTAMDEQIAEYMESRENKNV